MQYVFDSEKDQHAFDTIFDGYWPVRTKSINLKSIEEIEEEGYISTFNKEWDSLIMNEQVSVYRTIADMAEWLYDGKHFRLERSEDYLTIYDVIRHYVKMIADVFNHELALNTETIDEDSPWARVLRDVQKLEDLGNHIYPMVEMKRPKYVQTPQTGLLGLIARLNASNTIHIERDSRIIDGDNIKGKKRPVDIPVIDIRKELDVGAFERTRTWLRRDE